jgi:hypothetical protein
MKKETKLLEFLNQATAKQIDEFADGSKNGIGITIAKKIIQKRDGLPNGKFTSIQELSDIKGVGKDKIADMLSFIAQTPIESKFIKSRTIFAFAGGAPNLQEYKGEVKFELAEEFLDSKEDTKNEYKEIKYRLYYNPQLNKEQLFKSIENSRNFRNSSNDYWFAIQANDGRFISKLPNGDIGFSNTIGANEKLYAIQYASPHHPSHPYHSGHLNENDQQLFPFYKTAFSFGFNSPKHDVLYVDWGSQSIKHQNAYINILADPKYFFDAFGILSPPTWVTPDLFKAFTFANYADDPIPATDPRKFVGQEGNLLKLRNQIGWEPKNWFRYVDIVENVGIKAKRDYPGFRNRHMVITNGQVSFQHVHTWDVPPPASGRFDMYVFYGKWGDRQNIAPRVMFKSRSNGNYLSVNGNDVVLCTATTPSNESTFYVEQGWDGQIDDINLKTFQGKYLYGYQTYAKADKVFPLGFDQIEIVYP